MSKAAKTKAAPRGRPAKHGAAMVVTPLRLPQGMVDALDAIAAARMDAPDRSTVIRELLALALEARSKR